MGELKNLRLNKKRHEKKYNEKKYSEKKYLDKRYSDKKNKEEWRGWRFLFVSLAVTALSIIFFFSVRLILPKIEQRLSLSVEAISQRVNKWGGIRLKNIELEVASEDQDELLPQLTASLKQELDSYKGRSFWSVELAEVKELVEKNGWVDKVAVQRSFPDRLSIHITAKRPRYLVRGVRSWFLVDAKASVISISREIPGAWINLPLVFGKEKRFDRGQTVEELNRRLTDQRLDFQALTRLMDSVERRFHVRIESLEFKEDSWSEGSLVQMKIFSQNKTDIMGQNLGEEFEVVLPLRTEDGIISEQRLESLQYVLSDLRLKGVASAQILGQFDGRWIVSRRKER